MPVHELNTKVEFDEALKNSGGKLVVVDFSATWCDPCKMIGPKFLAMSNEFTDVLFYKVDVDLNDETAEACGIQAMPTFLFFKGGKDPLKDHTLKGADESKLRATITTILCSVVTMPVHELNTKVEFDEALKNSGGKLVVVDFSATWCGPCKMIGPKFLAMSNEFTDVLFYKVDVDLNDETAEACGIQAMPTFLFFKGGKDPLKDHTLKGADESKLRATITKLR